MRKSTVISKEIKGNAEKFKSYSEAWSRIKQAQDHGFFLEAIAIQESIISDRLISFLSRPDASNKCVEKLKAKKFVSFYKLIECWGTECPTLTSGSYSSLVDAVDNWRESRNSALHAIVKTNPGEAIQPIDEFLREAKKVAEEGEKLAREVCKWHQREKRSNHK